jgi:Arc/MetJ-type ribon-helix-helix transcriptional regulator
MPARAAGELAGGSRYASSLRAMGNLARSSSIAWSAWPCHSSLALESSLISCSSRAINRAACSAVLTARALPTGSLIAIVEASIPLVNLNHMRIILCRMARQQTLVQLSDELVAGLDARAGREGRSRSELIREAITEYLAADREAEIDRQIVDGYTRRPQQDLLAADWTARAIVAGEPWDKR